jgi:hypothetical protein
VGRSRVSAFTRSMSRDDPGGTVTRHTRQLALSLLTGALCGAMLLMSAPIASAALPAIKHVFVIVDENESASTTFGAASPAPYLSQTLVSEGAYLSQYYGVGHNSLDNYIAMVSGQAPNPDTSSDCTIFADFPMGDGLDSSGQQTGKGCVFPADVPSLMSQLDGAGLTWRAYEDSMGADKTRDNPGSTSDVDCGHPELNTTDGTETETLTDQYATKHDPFVYFHYVIDNQSECNANVVPLTQLPNDLASAATTPNYVFITPDLCDDGHDPTCANGGAGGLAQADTFLKTWVPQITASPAFQQNGLLIITFDESEGDDTSCCGEVPGPYDLDNGVQPGAGGPGGGVVGAVLLSPFIYPGTVSSAPYNHFSMLGTVEDIFGLPRLGEAVGTTPFGSDIFLHHSTPVGSSAPPAVAPQDSGLTIRPNSLAVLARASGRHELTITYGDTQAATTTLAVLQLGRGYIKRGLTCTALKLHQARPKHAKACTSTKAVTSFTHVDSVGSNTLTFNGRVHGHALAPGSYELTLTPSLGTLNGSQVVGHFRIVKSGS